jgi:hypothetical protein
MSNIDLIGADMLTDMDAKCRLDFVWLELDRNPAID